MMQWVFGLLGLAFALAMEPVWLHYWGWTPGKWIFGLKLRNENGEKLTLAQGYQRSFAVLKDGYGWDIPIWGLWKMWQARKLGLEEGRDCYWDEDEGCRYTMEERQIAGGWNYVLAQVLCAAALVLSMLWCAVPPCRGDLTVAEFAQNYNHSLRVQAAIGEDTYEPTLDSGGSWVERETPNMVFLEENRYDQPEFTVMNGQVTAVRLHMRSDSIMVSGGFRETMALMALIRSADGVNLFSVRQVLRDADRLFGDWENWEADRWGLHVEQRVEYTGYETVGFGALWAEDAQTPRHCEKTVTISLIE